MRPPRAVSSPIRAVPLRPGFVLPFLVASAILVAVPFRAATQETPPLVAAAERLEEAGRYGEAADSLLAYLRSHPREADVHWKAAQLLHRADRSRAAVREYEKALALAAADPWLRLEYADFLLSLERIDRARNVAAPVAEDLDASETARARALTVLGTAAYWRGDLATAARWFEVALSLDPDQGEAARQLREIRASTRPWVRLTLEGLDDNQPYQRARVELGAGFFPSPLWAVGAEVVPRVLDPSVAGPVSESGPRSGPGSGPGQPSGFGTEEAFEGRATVVGFIPRARLDVALGVGGVVQDGAGTWLGHAEVGVRMPSEVRLKARAERWRYLWTTASSESFLMVEAVEAGLDRVNHPGWAGEATLRYESFPGDNGVLSAWGWLLAPVVPFFRVGASLSWHDAEETRWSPTLQRYDPYFTPEEQRIAGVLAEVKLPLGPATFRVNGSYGVWAREEAPVADTASGGNVPGAAPVAFFERDYDPWSVTGALDVPITGGLDLHLEAERRETAFYELNRATLALVARFGGPSHP